MTIVVTDPQIGKKTVRKNCTACGGTGWITLIDNTKVEKVDLVKPEKSEPDETVQKLEGEGWGRKPDKRNRNKAHYFVDGVSLCKSVDSYRGTLIKNVEDDLKCINCLRKLNVKQ